MNTVYFDSNINDDARRNRLFEGQVFVFAPRASTRALCDFARELLEEAFHPYEPREAQHHMEVEDYVAIAAQVKPKFIHHPRSKELVKNILEEFACDLSQTYMDVPRLKIITSDRYLTAGVGYPFHPHRDTWYSAPQAQLNWWLPVYEIDSESSMAFHPHYWTNPVRNGSERFNYYEYVDNGRKNAAKYIKTDTRDQPRPEEPFQNDPHVRLVCPAGGLILFAGAQMHSTIPNTTGLTRYSIDFRTVNIGDLQEGRGAPNVDNAATGTSLRDFKRGTGLEDLPEELVARYDVPLPAKAGA